MTLDCVGFSRVTFYRIKKLYNETGDVVTEPSSQYTGRPCVFNLQDLHYLLELIRHRPDWFLDELTTLMRHNRYISVHYSTIHPELSQAGISLKKLRKIAKKRNEDVRVDFKRQMAQYLPDQFKLFIDKTSKDERTQIRRYGRAKRSQYTSMGGVFVRGASQ